MIDLREELILKGKWWRPGKHDSSITGQLEFKPSIQSLILHLNDSWKTSNDKLEAYKLIHGVTDKGKSVTLSHCREIYSTHCGEVSSADFDIEIAFVGIHISSEESLCWNEAYIGMYHLEKVANILEYPRTISIDSIKYFKAWDQEMFPLLTLDDELTTLSLQRTRTYSSKGKSVQIWEELVTVVKSKEKRSFSFYQHIIQEFQHLITLLCQAPSLYISVTLRSDLYQEELTDSSMMIPVDIVFPQGWVCALNSQRENSRDKHIWVSFSLKNGMTDFGEYVRKWFNVIDHYPRAIVLYFSMVYNPHLYIENDFLTLAIATEAVCRVRYAKGELSETEHAKRIASILSSVHHKWHDWLSIKLKYTNEIGLRKRLNALISDLSQHKFLLKALGKKKNFIHDVVQTRNYYVHPEEDSDSNVLSGRSLFILSNRLRLLLELVFFSELDLPEKELSDHFHRHYEYLFRNIEQIEYKD